MNYVHMMNLIYQFDFNWPKILEKYFQLQGNAAFGVNSLFSVDCLLFNSGIEEKESLYYLKFKIILIFPSFVLVICFFSWTVISFFKENYSYLRRELFLTLILVYFFLYPSIVRCAFEFYDDVYFDKLGFFLSSNYAVEVSTKTYYENSLKIALPSIIIWIIGIPTLILLSMIKFRNSLHKTTFKLIYCPLLNGYRSEVYYWEFIVIYRKLISISILLFINKGASIVKGLTLLFIQALSYYLQYSLKPYNSKNLNKIELFFLLTIFFTTFLGQYFLYTELNAEVKNLISILIICLNICLFCFWLYLMFLSSFEKFISFFAVFRRFKKGDSFEDEFYVEEFRIKGVLKSVNLEKDIYTFIEKENNEDNFGNDFKIQSMENLYEDVFTAEKINHLHFI